MPCWPSSAPAAVAPTVADATTTILVEQHDLVRLQCERERRSVSHPMAPVPVSLGDRNGEAASAGNSAGQGSLVLLLKLFFHPMAPIPQTLGARGGVAAAAAHAAGNSVGQESLRQTRHWQCVQLFIRSNRRRSRQPLQRNLVRARRPMPFRNLRSRSGAGFMPPAALPAAIAAKLDADVDHEPAIWVRAAVIAPRLIMLRAFHKLRNGNASRMCV